MGSEHHLFRRADLSVTSSLIKVGSTSYAVRQITSVRAEQRRPRLIVPFGLVFFSAIAALAPGGARVVGIAVALATVAWVVLQSRTVDVVLTTAAGEKKALSTRDQELSSAFVGAIEEAISR